MSVHLTEAAARQVQKQLEKRGGGLGLRLGVRKSGCSGFSYVIDFVDEIENADSVFEDFGVKVVVHQDSLAMLDGIRVDFKMEGLNTMFSFDNPNVQDSCGCGESFSV